MVTHASSPVQAVPAPDWQEALDLRPERRVEPPVHHRVGEGGGHGGRVAQAQDQVVRRVAVLKGKSRLGTLLLNPVVL